MAQPSKTVARCIMQHITRDEEQEDALRGAMCIDNMLHPFGVHARDLAVHLPGWCIWVRDTVDGEDLNGKMEFTSFDAAPSACARLNRAVSGMNCDTRGFLHVQPCPQHADMAMEERDALPRSCAHLQAAAAAYNRVLQHYRARPRTRAAVAAPPPAPAIITAAIAAAWKELPLSKCMVAQPVAVKTTSSV